MEENNEPIVVEKPRNRLYRVIRAKKNNEIPFLNKKTNRPRVVRPNKGKRYPHIELMLRKTKKEDSLVSDKTLSEKDERFPMNSILFQKLLKTQDKTLVSKESISTEEYVKLRCEFIRMADDWQRALKLLSETIYFAIHLYDQNISRIVFLRDETDEKQGSSSKRRPFSQIPAHWSQKSLHERHGHFVVSIMFTACKYMEIQVLDYKDFSVYSKALTSLLKLIEAEILEDMDFVLTPTVETSIYKLLRAEMGVKDETVFSNIEFQIVNGIRTGTIRRTNPISTIFGIFFRNFKFKMEDYMNKLNRVAEKYKIDKSLSAKLCSEFNAELHGFLGHVRGRMHIPTKLN